MSHKIEAEKLQKFVVGVKYLQFLFLAIFFYGTAMLSYDLIQLIENVVISPWSIGCTIFGGEGVIASFLLIRSTDKRIEKFIKEEKK